MGGSLRGGPWCRSRWPDPLPPACWESLFSKSGDCLYLALFQFRPADRRMRVTRRSSIVCVFHVDVSLFPHRGGSGVSSANNREKRIKNELIFSSRRFSQLTKNRSISDFMLPSSETRGVRAGLLLSTHPKRSVNTRVSVTRLHIRLLSFQVSVALAVAPLGRGGGVYVRSVESPVELNSCWFVCMKRRIFQFGLAAVCF